MENHTKTDIQGIEKTELKILNRVEKKIGIPIPVVSESEAFRPKISCTIFAGKVRSLSMRGQGLTQIPDELRLLENLERVDFSENKLQTVPPWVKDWNFLKSLGFHQNSFSDFPRAILELNGLEGLAMGSNRLKELPDEICQLNNLEYLNFSQNRLETLPLSIGNLRNLETLILQQNKLKKLVESIGALKVLRFLHLRANDFRNLPHNLGDCQGLAVLDVSNNHLTTIPESLGQLKKLERLDLSHNNLTSLPDEIGTLGEHVGDPCPLLELDVRTEYRKYVGINLAENPWERLPGTFGQRARPIFLWLERAHWNKISTSKPPEFERPYWGNALVVEPDRRDHFGVMF